MRKSILLLLLVGVCIQANAQLTNMHWWSPVNSDQSFISGRGWNSGFAAAYDRLPAKAKSMVRTAVWDLSHHTAGEYIDFKTTAKSIVVRYQVTGSLSMPHMPATGVSGVDLYAKADDGNWQWWKGRRNFGDTITYSFENIFSTASIHYFRLYLPLYNAVKWLQIGVSEPASIEPVTDKQPALVLYGTSILQGGCSSRPGLAWTNILSRKLDLPVVNLGFSGNGKLELPLIQLMNEVDANMYVLDCLPNLDNDIYSADTISHRIIQSVKALQTAHPGTPILLTEHAAGLRLANLDSMVYHNSKRVNDILRSTFHTMQANGIQNIWLLTAEEIGLGTESTVDGVHPNDIGMMQYAEAYAKKIHAILKK